MTGGNARLRLRVSGWGRRESRKSWNRGCRCRDRGQKRFQRVSCADPAKKGESIILVEGAEGVMQAGQVVVLAFLRLAMCLSAACGIHAVRAQVHATATRTLTVTLWENSSQPHKYSTATVFAGEVDSLP